jgi:BASS family bile acid:Na+ symporter
LFNKKEWFSVVQKACQVFTKLFPLWIALAVAIGLIMPAPFTFLAADVPYFVGIVMLAMGLTMSLDDFKLVLSRPKEVFIGVLLRYLIMPIVAVLVSKLLHLEPILAAGFILVGCCPSAVASNVMAFLSKGDTALSVTISSVNTLLSPFITPFVFVMLVGETVAVDPVNMLIDIAKIVLFPIALGVTIRMVAKDFVVKILPYMPFVSTVALLLIVLPGIALSASKVLSVALIAVVGVFLHNSTGLALGFFCSKKLLGLSQKKSQAIAFEVGMENTGIAVALALTYLNPLAAVPAAIFGACHNLTGSALASYWASRAVPEDDTTGNVLQGVTTEKTI